MQIPMRLHTQGRACGQGDAVAGDAWTQGNFMHREGDFIPLGEIPPKSLLPSSWSHNSRQVLFGTLSRVKGLGQLLLPLAMGVEMFLMGNSCLKFPFL